MFSDTVGKGLPMWLPKGTALRLRLQDFLRRIQARYEYQEVMCPPIGNKLLYITSGHYAKYGKDSFQPIHTPEEGEEYFLKPMNCPHHCMIYKNTPRSYKDLPLRLAEFGTVCRYEQSGELHGLTRVRSFTQDDAHIFCRPDQVKQEYTRVMDIISIVFKSMNFQNFEAQISLRDKVNREKYIGSDENWDKAEQAIIEACEETGLPAKIEYGEAAFYGPKLDFMVKDAIGRRWQLGTIQVDYNLPERFQLEYMGSDNQKHRPVMIHRAPFGSMERFCAVLIEHTGGKFPLWLTPDQAVILPISEKFNAYAEEVRAYLDSMDIRAIVEACEEKGLKAKVEYGEAAFYGPKLDFMVKDAIGRRWQLGTIQVDYNLPERFDLDYMGSDNLKHRPVMIHRAPFGSMERFCAVLIEHTAGKFPLWLTPDQVAILPISEKFNDYAEQVKAELRKFDVRAIVDDRNEKIGRKIRDNEMKRIPYMLIVGEKEAENGEVSVRKQGQGDQGSMKIADFAKNIAEEVSEMINKW